MSAQLPFEVLVEVCEQLDVPAVDIRSRRSVPGLRYFKQP
jgi:hypothetical protein